MQKLLYNLSLIAAMIFVPWVTQAQGVQNSTFSTGSDATAWITLSSSATHITAIEGEDDEASGCINIGFDFYFGGFTYTQFSCNSNGRFRLGPVACSYYWTSPFMTLTDPDNNDLPFITAFGMDNTLEATGSYVKYELVGTAPNRILVVEYLTPSEYNDEGDLVNYQIQLLEDSNRVRLVYGSSNASYFDEFQIGVAGSASDILMVNPNTHSTFTSNTSTTFDSWPGAGRYYQFTMGYPPLCPSIVGFDVENVTAGSAMLSWTAGSGTVGSYEIEYYAVGSTAAPTALTSTTPNVVVTGLDTNTTYVFRVRANCGTDGYGSWDSTTFTTNSFGCLDEHNYISGTGTLQTSGVPVNSSWGNTMCQSIYLASELIAAGFSSSGGDITDLTFTWTNNSSYDKYFTIYLTNTTTSEFTSASSSDWVATGIAAKVYEGPHPLNTSGSVTYHLNVPFEWDGHSNLCITTTMNQPSGASHSSSSFYGLSTATSPSVYRTMYKYQDSNPLDGSNPSSISPSSRSYNRPNVIIRSADCSALASCAAPAVMVDSVEATEVTVSWIPGYQETSWDVDYRVQGTNSWTTAGSFTTTSATISGLTPATNYDIRVMTICGDDTFATSVTALTKCVPIANTSLPFAYSFEDIASTGSGIPLAPCWSRGYQSGSTFNAMNYPYASTSYAHSGTKSLYYYGYSTTTSSWLCLPEFEDSINTLQLQFWAKKSSDSYTGVIKIGVMTDPTDINTFTLVQTVTATNGTEWNRFDLPLSGAPGTGLITILVDGGATSSYNYIYLDDIEVREIPACPHVWNLQLDSVYVDWAAISWQEMGTATAWMLEYDTVDFVPGTYTAANSEMVYDTAILLSNLDTGYTYYVYVRADCSGDTSTYESLVFTTLSGLPATVPYLCSFEGHGTNGWEFANGTQVNHWMVGNSTGNGGRSMYITNNDVDNTYTISSTSNVYAYRVFNITDTGEFVYSFDWKSYGESCCDYIRAAFMPGTFEPVAGNSSGWTQATGTPVTGAVADISHSNRMNVSSVWNTETGTFNITTPGVYKMVFFWHNDGSVGTMPPGAIDNIQLAHNTCPMPSNITATWVGSTDATITWNPGGSETQWIVVNGESEVDVYDTTYTFTDLQPNTSYSFGVRAVCGGDDTSMAATVSVTTQCGGLSAFPFMETFENQATTTNTTSNNTFIRCWHHLNNGTSYMGYPYIANSTTYNHTPGGNMGLYWYGSTTTGTYGDYYYIVLPSVDTDIIDMNTMRLKFWAKASSTSYHPVMNVGVMTDPTDVNTFQLVATHNINPGSSTAWAEFVTEFDEFTGMGSYIAIRALRPSSTWYCYMDDITLDQIPDCPEPSNMVAQHVTTETADLNWTENGEATGWTIEYGEHGFTRGSGVSESVGSLPHTIVGLSPNTQYDVYVTPDCIGIAGTSMFSFRTECTPLGVLPYTMGFETTDGISTTGGSTSTVFVECWHRLNNGSDYFGYPYVGSSTTYNHTSGGSRGLYWYNTTTTGTYGDYQVVVLPAVDTDNYALNTLRISFWGSISSSTPVFQIGVMTDPNDISTFQLVQSVTLNGAAWRKYVAYLENFTGTGNYVAIRANRASWTAYVDDITLEVAPECPEVSDLVATNITTTSANISWTENGDAESWVLEYGPQGFAPGSGISESVSTLPFALTGLTANTEYDVYVTPSCTGTTGSTQLTFRTECLPTSTIPLTMGFESSEGVATGSSTTAVFVDCWHRLNNGTQYFGYPYVGSSTTYAHTGSRGLYWFNTTTTGTYGDYQIVVLPAIDVTVHPIGTLLLKFWAKASSSSYNPVFQVGVMTDPNNPGTFQQLASVDVGNSTQWEEYTTGLAGYTGSAQYIAIRAMRSSWTAYVDDISLELAPACPQVIDIVAENVGTTGAQFRWGIQSGFADIPSQYEIEVVPSDTSESFTPFTSNHSTFLLSGLQPGHTYSLRIRGNCGVDGYGEWSEYYDFGTAGLPCGEVDTSNSFVDTIGNGTTTNTYLPSYSFYNYGLSQQIYTAAEIGGGGDITSISVMPSAVSQQRTFEIYLAHTSSSSVSSFIHPADMVRVYDGAPITLVANQWLTFPLDHPFTYNGSDNLLVCFRDMTGSYVSPSNSWFVHSNPHGNSVYAYQDGSAYDPFTYTGGTSTSYRNNIIIEALACLQTATCAAPMVVVDSTSPDYISVNWTPGYQETSWDVAYRTVGGAWINEGTVTTPGYAFTNLTADQAYEIRITAQCTDSNMSTTITASTPCAAQPLPFFTSFEDFPGSSASYPMPACWKRVSNYYPYYPYSSTSYRVSGNYGVYMYSTSSTYSYFTLPPFEVSVDSLVADFWLMKSNTSYSHSIKVGVMTDPEDVSTFTELATVVPTYLNEWEHFEVYFDRYTGTGRYIAFMSPNGEYSYPYLDDLTVDVIPDCRRVQNVAVSNVTTNSVHVSWTPGDVTEFDVVCVPTGTDPDSGFIYNVSNEDSITITGLMHSTSYTVYVRGYCYPDTSHWSLGTRFRTSCGMIDSLPFFEDLETVATGSTSSYDFIPCWTLLNNGSTRYPYVSNSTSYSHNGGSKGLYWYCTNSSGYGDYQYVILPPIDTTALPINTLQFSVWIKSNSTSYLPEFEVGIMNSNTDTAFTRLRSFATGPNTNWHHLVVPLSRYTGTGNYVALRSKFRSSYWYAYVDEFMIDTLPSCSMPVDVFIDSVTTNSIAVSWIPSGSETQWQVSVNGVDTVVNDSTLSLTGLTPNTPYTISVRALCGPGTMSDEVTVTARTECEDIRTLPWHDDLETYTSTSSSSPDLIPCWNKITDATSYYYPYLSNSTTYSHDGGTMGFYWYCSSTTSSYGSYQMVALPVIDTNVIQMNGLQMAFWAKSSSTSYSPSFIVGVMQDNNASSFVPLDTVEIGNSTEWQIYEVSAFNYTGHGNRFVLRSEYALTNSYWYAYVDDFFIEPVSPCPRPDSLLASNATSSSVELSWVETGDATNWVIEYGPRGFAPGTGTQVSVSTNPFTLTGLPSSYDGDFYVRALCNYGDTGYYNRVPGMFSTAQAPATIPYHFNLEDSTEWAAWQTNSNSYINWFRGTAVADSGNYAMYISPNNGTTYGNEGFSSVVNAAAFRDIDFGTVDTSFTITFRAKVGGTISNTYDGLMVFLVDPAIPVIASSSGITSPWGNVNDLYTITFARLDTAWNTYTASFDTIHGVQRVAFFWFNQNTGSSYPYIGGPAAVDNIHIDVSSCPRPVNLDTAMVTSTTATLHWDGPSAAQYRVAYRMAGSSASTNTYVTTSTNSVTLTGLSPMVSYYAWVQKICGSDSSLFSDRLTFTMNMCDDAVEIYPGDSASTIGTSNAIPVDNYWRFTVSEIIIDSTELGNTPRDINGIKVYYDYSSPTTVKNDVDIYIKPTTKTTFASTTDCEYVNSDAVLVYHGPFNCSEGWNVFGFDTVYHYDGSGNIMIMFDDNSNNYDGSSYVFRTRTCTGNKSLVYYSDSDNPVITSPNLSSYAGNKYIYTYRPEMQLISCGSTPVCHQPIITGISHTYNTATVTWTGDGNSYEVNIKETAAPNWPATDIAVTGTSYTFTGLTPTTNYTFRVRQNCTADSLDYSEWVVNGFLTDSLPCLAPDSLHVTAVTNATATFDWSVNGNENVWDIHVWYGSFDSIYRTILRPATVGGFTAGLTYNAAIRAVCGVDMLEGDWSDTVQFTTAVCPDITGLSTSNVTTNSVTLNWNSNPMALRWNIEYGPTGFTQGQGTQAVSNTNSYVVTGLSDGITYDFYVKAVCGDDWTSENWVGTSATTQEGTIPCDAPTGVGTAVADNSVTVNWTAGTGNISFELEYGPRGFSHGAGSTTTATGSPAVIANLDYETQYDVYVRAVCEQNIFSPWSAVSTFTTGERPSEDCDPVQNLTVTNVTETSADVTWQPGPTGDHWQVVLTDGTGSTVSDNVTAERQATFSNLTPGTNYTVKVRTDCGDGNYSAYVTANFRTLGGEGIEDVDGINCRIFPNPATSSTTISVSGVNGMVRIAVVDMNGRTVATETLECSADCEKTMEVDKLAQGAYFVRITADNTNMVRKLIVR